MFCREQIQLYFEACKRNISITASICGHYICETRRTKTGLVLDHCNSPILALEWIWVIDILCGSIIRNIDIFQRKTMHFILDCMHSLHMFGHIKFKVGSVVTVGAFVRLFIWMNDSVSPTIFGIAERFPTHFAQIFFEARFTD